MNPVWTKHEDRDAWITDVPGGQLIVCKGRELDGEGALMIQLAAQCFPEEWFSLEIPFAHWPSLKEAQEATIQAYTGATHRPLEKISCEPSISN